MVKYRSFFFYSKYLAFTQDALIMVGGGGYYILLIIMLNER